MPRSAANPSHALPPAFRRQCEEIQVAFGGRVRELRLARELSIEELADRSTLDASYVGQVERGTRNLSLFNVWRLASGLSVRAEELMSALPSPKKLR